MTEQLELSLPFEDFTGKIGSQVFAKQNYKRGPDVMLFYIPFKDILIWEGYNARTVFDGIEELADSLISHGQKSPFQLVLVKDGNRAFLKKGGRRYRAYQLLIQQGRFDPETSVPFELTNTKETIEEMILDLHVSNNLQKPLEPIDLATVAYRLKYYCGKEKSNQEVADLMNYSRSRQTVDNLILIYEAPDDVKNEIRLGTMNMTNAVAFLRAQKKQSKNTDKKEEESHKTSASAPSLYNDALKEEMKELEDINDMADSFIEAQNNRERLAKESLLVVADEVLCNYPDLNLKIGYRLAAPACREWEEDFVEPDSGEIVKIPAKRSVYDANVMIDTDVIDQLINSGVASVFIFKEKSIAASVITEPIAQREKGKYDESRPEIAQVQNVIVLADRIETRINKIECIEDGTKEDISNWVKWMQKDLESLREWVHNNRKFNKLR